MIMTYLLESLSTLKQHLQLNYVIYQLATNANGENFWQSASDNINSYKMSNDKKSIDNDLLATTQPLSSSKGIFFAEQENLFHFDGECFRETLPTPSPFVLFGVTSCDLTAIAYQDQFFADDPYYQARRKQALLIGKDCIQRCEHGFCADVNAGPGVNEDFADLIFHPLDDENFLLLVCSEKGEQAIDGLKLPIAKDTVTAHRQQNIDQCRQQFNNSELINQGIEMIANKQLPDDFWQQFGLQCLSCSGCSSLCPTCSCYATRDVDDEQGGVQRQRFWDSCLYENFQLEASQHNPSRQAGDRIRRFWQHKFSHQTQEQFGRYGCVGCGRCEQTCPGNIGALSMMNNISNFKHSTEND
jgi:ferredoxin